MPGFLHAGVLIHPVWCTWCRSWSNAVGAHSWCPQLVPAVGARSWCQAWVAWLMRPVWRGLFGAKWCLVGTGTDLVGILVGALFGALFGANSVWYQALMILFELVPTNWCLPTGASHVDFEPGAMLGTWSRLEPGSGTWSQQPGASNLEQPGASHPSNSNLEPATLPTCAVGWCQPRLEPPVGATPGWCHPRLALRRA